MTKRLKPGLVLSDRETLELLRGLLIADLRSREELYGNGDPHSWEYRDAAAFFDRLLLKLRAAVPSELSSQAILEGQYDVGR